jgi:type VI secretion system protein ImpC
LADYLHRLVAPHLVRPPDQEQRDTRARLDDLIAAGLRAILHDPGVRALEALWRSVDFLARRTETGEMLHLYLLDVSRPELAADLMPERDVRQTEMYQLLASGAPGGTPWALIVACETIDAATADIALSARLARLAAAVGAPWILGAGPRLALGPSGTAAAPPPDGSSTADAWTALRHGPEAAHVAMAFPGFLLRLPYGAEDEPCELVPFEEVDATSRPDHFLWGHASVACALVLTRSAAPHPYPPARTPSPHLDIPGLPLHLVRGEGETTLLPCVEVELTEQVALRVLERGTMPLVWMRDTDVIRVLRLQSIAYPPAPLAGRWLMPA